MDKKATAAWRAAGMLWNPVNFDGEKFLQLYKLNQFTVINTCFWEEADTSCHLVAPSNSVLPYFYSDKDQPKEMLFGCAGDERR